MKKFCWAALAALAFALMGLFGVHTAPVAAQDSGCGSCGVVQGDPSGPPADFDAQCVTVGGVSVAYDDDNGDFYGWACFALPIDDNCPDGTVLTEPSAPGPEQEVCAWSSEGLNDGFHDSAGNLIPSQGECPSGFYVWPTPDNGLDHDICSEIPENPGNDHGDTGKAIYPVIGPGYIVAPSGADCLDQPNGTAIDHLDFGAEVSELADGIVDNFQLVSVAVGQPECYVDVHADGILSDSPPTDDQPPVNTDDGSGQTADTASSVDDSGDTTIAPPSVGGETTATVGNVQVTGLPNTGIGPMQQPHSWGKWLFELVAMLALALGFVALAKLMLLEECSQTELTQMGVQLKE